MLSFWTRINLKPYLRSRKTNLAFHPQRETTFKTQAYMEDNIKMYLQEVGSGSLDWIDLGSG